MANSQNDLHQQPAEVNVNREEIRRSNRQDLFHIYCGSCIRSKAVSRVNRGISESDWIVKASGLRIRVQRDSLLIRDAFSIILQRSFTVIELIAFSYLQTILKSMEIYVELIYI